MSSKTLEKLRRDNSLKDFEFFECGEDLEVDLSTSSLNEASEQLRSGISSVMSALSLIAEEQGITIAVPVQTMAATAVGAITGSLLGGPSGLAIGLITGAVIAYRTSPNKPTRVIPAPSKSTIKEIFSQMTLHQKKEMIKELLSCLKHSNVRSLILEILKNECIRNMAMDIISSYLKKKMGVSLIKHAK